LVFVIIILCKNLHGNEKKTCEKKSVYIQNVLFRR
jgi:hypothetical protein